MDDKEKLEKIKRFLNSSQDKKISIQEYQKACLRTVKEFESNKVKIISSIFNPLQHPQPFYQQLKY